MEVGDLQTDPDGTQWVVIAVYGRGRVSRVKRNSLAHEIYASRSPTFAGSIGDNGVETPSGNCAVPARER